MSSLRAAHDRPAPTTASPGRLHLPIIMDGNGGWPRPLARGGGAPPRRRPLKGPADCGATRLTVFGFSTENWGRPRHEVSELMALLKAYFDTALSRLEREGVHVRIAVLGLLRDG